MSATGGGGDLLALIKMLGWLQTGFHVAIAAAFVIFCFVRARQIGVGGASLLAIVGLLDLTSVLVWRLGMAAVSASPGSITSFDTVLDALSAMDILFNLVSIGLLACAFFLLRKPPMPAWMPSP